MQIKPLIAAVLTILLITTGSGCLWLRHTTFTLLSHTMSDDDGFPALGLSFNLSDYATVSVTDPTGHELCNDTFFQGVHTAQVVLGAYRHSPPQGAYTIRVSDAQQNLVSSTLLRYNVSSVNISACNQAWFSHSNESVLSLTFTITNTGQLPFYPDTVKVSYGDVLLVGPVMPTVVLPQQTSEASALVVMQTLLTPVSRMTIQLLDSDNDVVCHLIQNISSVSCPSLDYSWYYRGHHQLTLPNATGLYLYDRSLPREASEDYALYVFNSLDDAYLSYVMHRIIALSGTDDMIGRLNFIAGFVQSLEYREDDPLNASFEYPRYPVETLNEHGGDCEDKAILCASLLDFAGYNVSLLRLPDHMAVGVKLASLEGYTPFADSYYFLEATAGSSPVGRIPAEYQGETNYTVYPITPRPLLVHDWLNATRLQTNSVDYVQVTTLVKNLGAASAPVVVRAFFSDASEQYGTQQALVPNLEAGGEAQVTLRVNVPSGIATILKTQVLINGTVQQEKESTTMFQ